MTRPSCSWPGSRGSGWMPQLSIVQSRTWPARTCVDVLALRQKLAKDGVTVQSFRDGLRDQLTFSRLHEREVESSIKVSDAGCGSCDSGATGRRHGSIRPGTQYCANPDRGAEKANGEEAAALYVKPKSAAARPRWRSFTNLVKEFSAADRNNGGQIGLRRGDRLPPSFVNATQGLKVGEIADVVRTVGFPHPQAGGAQGADPPGPDHGSNACTPHFVAQFAPASPSPAIANWSMPANRS